MEKEVKWGICWKECLVCKKCKYESPVQKLYEEVTNSKGRGRRAGGLNRGLQVGLSHTMISNAAARNILSTLNVPAPAYSSMQRQANAVGEILIQENRRDMAQRLRSLVNLTHKASGQNDIASIMAEGDARYNNGLRTAKFKTPFQPATQMAYTITENATTNKNVVAVVCKNKLCKTADILRSKGKAVTCPNHPGHCSANLQPTDSIGDEESWAKQGFQEMFCQNPTLAINYFTSDGDSRAFKGLKDAQSSHNNIEPTNLRDPRHFSNSQCWRIQNAHFTKEMFEGPTMDKREKQQKQFATELSHRCAAEFKACHKKDGSKDMKAMKNAMRNVPHCLLKCYQGDCDDCNQFSFVCGSKFPANKRWQKSFVPPDFQINPTYADVKLLLSCINMRLGPDALEITRFNTNTQKSESVNRAYSRSNPKIVTHSRNYESRIHSATHRVNAGISGSIVQQLQATGVTLRSSSRAGRQLEINEKRDIYHRKRKMGGQYKQRFSASRARRYKSYFEKHGEAVNYSKGLMDNHDHTYSQPGSSSGKPKPCSSKK